MPAVTETNRTITSTSAKGHTIICRAAANPKGGTRRRVSWARGLLGACTGRFFGGYVQSQNTDHCAPKRDVMLTTGYSPPSPPPPPPLPGPTAERNYEPPAGDPLVLGRYRCQPPLSAAFDRDTLHAHKPTRQCRRRKQGETTGHRRAEAGFDDSTRAPAVSRVLHKSPHRPPRPFPAPGNSWCGGRICPQRPSPVRRVCSGVRCWTLSVGAPAPAS